MRGDYDEEEEDEGEDYEISVLPVPPGFGALTSAQQALAELLQLPQELLVAAARHSNAVKVQLEREKREQEQVARLRHLQDIHNHQDDYWQQVEQAVIRQSGTGYDEAVRLLIELRDAAHQFKETQKFQNHFSAWVRPQLRRPAFVKRLQLHNFTLPDA